MEDKARVDTVPVSERHRGGPGRRTHRGLPPDPQRGALGREGGAGSEVGGVQPPPVAVQTKRVQRSAALWPRRAGAAGLGPGNPTSGRAGRQSCAQAAARQLQHALPARRADGEEAEERLQNFEPEPGRSRAEPVRRADEQVLYLYIIKYNTCYFRYFRYLDILTKRLCFPQAGAGPAQAADGAADEQAERAGAAQSHLQPDQQREEPAARGVPAAAVQHAAPEQVRPRPQIIIINTVI